jgi:secondary thiamine-phosphate synthase enzyme
MSKSSTVFVRQTPPQDRDGTVTSGTLAIHAETFAFDTRDRVELVDLTERVAAIVRGSGIREGLASLWSAHTTCAVFINEDQAALHTDIKQFLEQIVSRDGKWMHNDPAHSDCDRNNADAHLRAILLGHSMTLQIAGGELVLGQWQRVIAAELDGPRTRSFRLHVQGLGAAAD